MKDSDMDEMHKHMMRQVAKATHPSKLKKKMNVPMKKDMPSRKPFGK